MGDIETSDWDVDSELTTFKSEMTLTKVVLRLFTTSLGKNVFGNQGPTKMKTI